MRIASPGCGEHLQPGFARGERSGCAFRGIAVVLNGNTGGVDSQRGDCGLKGLPDIDLTRHTGGGGGKQGSDQHPELARADDLFESVRERSCCSPLDGMGTARRARTIIGFGRGNS